MGPKAGSCGGEVVFSGSFDELQAADTLTAKHLKHSVHFKKEYRPIMDWFVLDHATLHNLKNVSVKIPQKALIIVTGIAGSGKSSLINGPICKGLGLVYTDLAFMDTVATVCGACEGRRYRDEVLAYTVKQKNINDVLNMTVDEALLLFDNTEIIDVLERLKTVGIGPGAGQKGGHVVYSGRPDELLSVERSLTGRYIRQYMKE